MKRRQNPFKKTALIYTNIPQGHDVLEQGVCPQSALSFLCSFLHGHGLGTSSKECCQQLGNRLSVLTSSLLLTWKRASPCYLDVLSEDPNHICEI